jgi:hypothetical protein
VVLVCCSGISSDDRIISCSGRHSHCSQCADDGCVLCGFRRFNSWNETLYRDLPAALQHILYACHIWETKYEEAQKSTMNNSVSVQSKTRFVTDDPLTETGQFFSTLFIPKKDTFVFSFSFFSL